MPNLPLHGLTHRHYIPAILEETLSTFTGDPIYSQPLVPNIRVRSLDKTTTHYTFDPFNPHSAAVNGDAIYCSINLSLSHHGTFEFQLDASGTRDLSNIINGKRVIISMGKSADSMFTHLSGMIRQTGYTRGCENNLLYNVSGFGTGIRLNERILDVLMDEPRVIDGSTIDTTDPVFAANRVVDDALDDDDYYPRGVYPSEVEGTGGYQHINSSGSEVDSPITDFIPGVVLRFGEIADLYNQIENYTGARIYVDESDRIQIQPIKTPLSQNIGFKITTNPLLESDFADTTLYPTEEYSWHDSIATDSGFSNSLFGILSADPAIDKEASSVDDFLENKTVEIAMRFRPITNPHWRLWCGVEGVGLTNVQSENSVRGRWRICRDDNGIPMNTGGIIANKYMYPNEFYNTADGGLQTIQIMGVGNTDLDENNWYWLILSSVNSTATEYWRWYYDIDLGSTWATAPPATSTADDGGTGWTLGLSRRFVMFQTRFKSEPHNILDVLSVRKRILIESVVPSFPQQIKTKRAAVKYLAGLIHNTSRPKRVFEFPSLTIPNKPIFPGDTACIVDDRFNFSTSGNPVIGGQITDINYSMGIKGGGLSPLSKGQSTMSLSVVAFPGAY